MKGAVLSSFIQKRLIQTIHTTDDRVSKPTILVLISSCISCSLGFNITLFCSYAVDLSQIAVNMRRWIITAKPHSIRRLSSAPIALTYLVRPSQLLLSGLTCSDFWTIPTNRFVMPKTYASGRRERLKK